MRDWQPTTIAADFVVRAAMLAAELEDRRLRYVSSPQEHDLAFPAAWPFVYRNLTRRFPWEETL